MDEVVDDGYAELLEDDSIEISFEPHNSDDAILKAVQMTFSTPCQELEDQRLDDTETAWLNFSHDGKRANFHIFQWQTYNNQVNNHIIQ